MRGSILERIFSRGETDYSRYSTEKLLNLQDRLEQDLLLSEQYRRRSSGDEAASHEEMSWMLKREIRAVYLELRSR